MKVKSIIPNTSYDFVETYENMKNNLIDNSIDVQIDVTCLKEGPVSLETGLDEAMASDELIKEVRKANEEGYDAITIDCAADPCEQVLKEISDIPVVFAGEASYYFAMGLSRKFSLITVLDNTKSLNEINLRKYGINSRVASVRSVNIPVTDVQNENKSYNTILDESRRAIEEDGAHAIVLSCTGMSSITPKLQNALGVPVIDPRRASIHLAISFISMNLTLSKVSFMKPPNK